MRDRLEIVENNGEYALVRVKSKDLPKLKIQKEYRELLLESYIERGFPKKEYTVPRLHGLRAETWKDGKKRSVARNAKGKFVSKWTTERSKGITRRDRQGNVVLAYTSSCILMLDCDLKTEEEVIEFARDYALEHDLGSVAVWKTSDSNQVDLYGNRLGNYCIIFGKIISWDEVKWHVQEAFRYKMVNKGFVIIRKFGSITIRINAKNDKIPPPMPISYFSNGGRKARKGVIAFTRHWVMCRSLG